MGRWSPDGSMVAFVRGAFDYDLFVVNADGRGERPLYRSSPPMSAPSAF
jgi:Tol biopolymer transport system component